MVSFFKKAPLFLFALSTLFLLSGCSFVDESEEGSVSTSTSSSETGDGFTVQDDITHSHTASVVIGQTDFHTNTDKVTAADSVSYPSGNPTVVDGMLYLPDTLNYRLAGHNSVPTSYPNAADFVIGQESLTDSLTGNSALQNYGMQTVTVANGKLLVTDWGNNRILLYNRRPVSGPGKADVVVGQTDFGESGSDTKNNRLDSPKSLYVTGNKLIVADSMNNRILIWNSIPTVNGAAANIVLGHSDFDTKFSTGVNASTLNFPTAVWSNGTMLAVLDAGNNRILIWNSFPASNQPADVVLGQADFVSKEANQGFSAPTASTLNFSTDGGGLYSNGIQLFVADSGNNRVLIWNFPLISTYNEPADGLIGQDDFTLSGANREVGSPDADSFSNPTGVYQFYNKLIVTDTGNNRYLIFNSK